MNTRFASKIISFVSLLAILSVTFVGAVSRVQAGVNGLTYTGQAGPPGANLALWYRQPATSWDTQALPIGNGFVGGMVFGAPDSDRIQFNEHSLWTGVRAAPPATAARIYEFEVYSP